MHDRQHKLFAFQRLFYGLLELLREKLHRANLVNGDDSAFFDGFCDGSCPYVFEVFKVNVVLADLWTNLLVYVR